MGENAQVKDVKTGQVQRIANATKPVPSINGVVKITKNGDAKPNSATPAGGSGAKKSVKGKSYTLNLNERFPNQIQRKAPNTNGGAPAKIKEVKKFETVGATLDKSDLSKKMKPNQSQDKKTNSGKPAKKADAPSKAVRLEID